MNELILLIGIPGSGKTTYIKKNFDEKYVVNVDDIRKELTGNISNQSQNIKAWQIAIDRTKHNLIKYNKSVLDAANTSSHYRNVFLQNFPTEYKIGIIFKMNPDLSKKRIYKDLKSGKDRSNVPPEIIDNMYNDFLKGRGDLRYQFDKIIYANSNKEMLRNYIREYIKSMLISEDENEDDYNLEFKFANELLSGTETLTKFPYIKDYFDTLKSESKFLKSPVLFIGSGPLPLSPMMLTKLGFKCDGMDFESSAISVSKRILMKYKMYNDIKIFYGDATATKNYGRYNSIIVALEAGVNDDLKKKIFENILKESNKNVIILVRSSTLMEESFVDASHYITKYFDVVNKVKTFGGYSSTYILKKKTRSK